LIDVECDGTKLYEKIGPTTETLNFYKVETQTTGTPESFIDLLDTNYFEKQVLWNDLFLRGTRLEVINDEISVLYWRNNYSLLRRRDFIVVRRLYKRKDGSVVILDKSIEYYKPRKTWRVPRAHLFFSVRMITPIEEGKYKLIHLTFLDLKGIAPPLFCNLVTRKVSVAQNIKIRDLLEKK